MHADLTIKNAQTKQPRLVRHFMRVVENNQLSHAYLFSGEAGSGKLAVALTIAMRLFCPNVKKNLPCGKCNYCQRIANHEHPDVLVISPTGATIKIDQVRQLEKEFTRSATEGNIRVFIINGADKMTTSAMNSLLKFIEEPSGHIVSFLLTSNKSAILPTIISRTQVVEFPRVNSNVFIHELQNAHISPYQYHLLATMTSSVKIAQKWNKNNWFNNLQIGIGQWFQLIANHNLSALIDVQTHLMPLIKTPLNRSIANNMLIQIWRDVMNVKYEQIDRKELNFPQFYSSITKIANGISTNEFLRVINLILNNDKLLACNVSFQNILEATTLKLFQIL